MRTEEENSGSGIRVRAGKVRRLAIACVIASAVLAMSCAAAHRGPAANDAPRERAQRPAVVVLSQGGTDRCYGALIAARLVLTAAHCLWWHDEHGTRLGEIAVEELRVRPSGASPGGESSPSSKRPTVAVKSLHTPAFDGDPKRDSGNNPEGLGRADDVALLWLERGLGSDGLLSLLPTAQTAETLNSGALVLVPRLRDLPAARGDERGESIFDEIPLGRHNGYEFIAGGAGWPDVCKGGSGMPAYVRGGTELYLFGILSRGVEHSDHSCGAGGIWTIAPRYRSWIQSISNELRHAE